MNFKASLTMEYGSVEEARAVERALDPDNGDFVKTWLDGASLKATICSDNASSLRHTLDDLLTCLKLAEEAVGIKDPVQRPITEVP